MPSGNVLNVVSGQAIINTNNKGIINTKNSLNRNVGRIFFATNDKSVPNTKVRDYFLCDKVLN